MEIQTSIMGNKYRYGHRWTNEELKSLLRMWNEGRDVDEIALTLGVTRFSVLKMSQRLRKEGIPMPRRTGGHKAGRSNMLWTQSEIDYLVKRRKDGATSETIAAEIDRTCNSVQMMILNLKKEGVNITSLGRGSRRLWSTEALMVSEEK